VPNPTVARFKPWERILPLTVMYANNSPLELPQQQTRLPVLVAGAVGAIPLLPCLPALAVNNQQAKNLAQQIAKLDASDTEFYGEALVPEQVGPKLKSTIFATICTIPSASVHRQLCKNLHEVICIRTHCGYVALPYRNCVHEAPTSGAPIGTD